MKKYFNSTIKSLTEVLRQPSYILTAVFFAFLMLMVANLLPNYQFASIVLTSPTFSLVAKLKILAGMLEYFRYNSTLFSQALLILTSALAGLNVALVAFYLRRKIVSDRLAGIGVIGMVASFFGVGCSACGSVLLSSVLGIGASSHLINLLPLKGVEFGFLSAGILSASTIYVGKKIQEPNSCRINSKK